MFNRISGVNGLMTYSCDMRAKLNGQTPSGKRKIGVFCPAGTELTRISRNGTKAGPAGEKYFPVWPAAVWTAGQPDAEGALMNNDKGFQRSHPAGIKPDGGDFFRARKN